jgi:hypothetical protein
MESLHPIKNGDRVMVEPGVFGIVVCVYKEGVYTKVEVTVGGYPGSTTSTMVYGYSDDFIVIPSIQFANDGVYLTEVKPGCLVQDSNGTFAHIVKIKRINTSTGTDYTIITTHSEGIDLWPANLIFIG